MQLWMILLLACGGADAPVSDPTISSEQVEPDGATAALTPSPLALPGKPGGPIAPKVLPLPKPKDSCEYEPFETTCKLVDVKLSTMGSRGSVMARYAVVGEDREVPWNLYILPDRVSATEALVRANAEVPCMGLRRVKGTGCGPGRVRVVLPPLDGAPSSLPSSK